MQITMIIFFFFDPNLVKLRSPMVLLTLLANLAFILPLPKFVLKRGKMCKMLTDVQNTFRSVTKAQRNRLQK